MIGREFEASISRRVRKRTTRAGKPVRQTRFVLSYRCPDSGRRTQKFFQSRPEAEQAKAALVAEVNAGRYVDPRSVPTVGELVEHWLEVRSSEVKASTFRSYQVVAAIIVGPILEGSPAERAEFTATGTKPHGNARVLPMLGRVKANELSTAMIRRWHGVVKGEVGRYSANRSLSMLKSALALGEEDFGIRAPAMPTNLGKRQARSKKQLLSLEQVRLLLDYARQDHERGLYYAWPFLTGTRISEQLGLLWEDVDFDAGVIRIRRIQERDGMLRECTKTEAGMRDIPMSPMLKTMIVRWRLHCPRLDGQLYRAFPGPGRLQPWPLPRKDTGRALSYHNFLKRRWKPVFEKLDLPYVSPHAARHMFVSALQAQGVEVAVVAKLAGHANPSVTLGHYTQPLRDGKEAVKALEAAYR